MLRLVFLGHMVASHQHFRKVQHLRPSSRSFTLLSTSTSSFSTAYSPQNTFCPPLHLLGHALQLVCDVHVPADRFGVAQKRKESIGFGLPPSHEARINCSPTLPQFPKRFPGLLFCFRPVHELQVLGQGLPILFPLLVQGRAYGMKHAKLPVRFWEDLPDHLLKAWQVIGDEDPHPSHTPPPKFLEDLLPVLSAFSFRPKDQKPRISRRPSSLIPTAMYTGSLALFPRRMERNVPSRNTA